MSQSASRLLRYSKGEVAGVLRNAFTTDLDRKKGHVKLMDVWRAMQQLTPKQREAVFLIDVCHLTQGEAADYCNIAQPTMWERHRRGLLNVVNYLNGEPHSKRP